MSYSGFGQLVFYDLARSWEHKKCGDLISYDIIYVYSIITFNVKLRRKKKIMR
jgi:hypothetical protein